ncbi:MAG: rod shape-determining protein MreC [Candidatus Desulfofervidaceae bacterium]|nr:rod shape-determining protein MreC [Candidatus Desulfofervidaceae bacterium]
MLECSAPIAQGISSIWHQFQNIKEEYFELKEVKRENLVLKKRLESLQAKEISYQELLLANQRLEKLLSFKKKLTFPTLGARVISYAPNFSPRIIFLDRGKKDGVNLYYPVVNFQGIVGQVVSLSPHYAKVLLIIDPNSRVEVMSQRTRVHGILKGTGINLAEVIYVPNTEDIKEGDIFITSGLDGIFPKGISVGKVINVFTSRGEIFKKIILKTSVDFRRLEEVLILLKPPVLPYGKRN